MANWTKVVGIFTGLLFLANIVSDLFIYQQWRTASQAQSDVREQSRAYFGIGGPVQVTGAVDKDKKPTVGFMGVWQNFGSTRTKWAAGWVSIKYFSDDVPYNMDFTRPGTEISPPTKTVVGPNGLLQTGGVGISSADAIKAGTGQGTLIAWGEVEYADLFSPDVTRRSRFCIKLVPGGSSIDAATHETTVLYQNQPYRADCNKND